MFEWMLLPPGKKEAFVNRTVDTLLVAAMVVAVSDAPFAARMPQPAAGTPAKIDACSLLTKAEVKEHLPWAPHVDSFPVEREDVGATGTACEYVTVRIQILAYSRGFIDAVHKSRTQEPVAGLGDEAYISANRTYYAELVAKVGPRIVTLQASIPRDGTYETTKAKTIALAKALIAKMPAP